MFLIKLANKIKFSKQFLKEKEKQNKQMNLAMCQIGGTTTQRGQCGRKGMQSLSKMEARILQQPSPHRYTNLNMYYS
jgi:hypothetical protein